MPKILSAADLMEDDAHHEVSDAFVMLQEGVSPIDIIHYLRGEAVKLLDPDQFAPEVQERFEQLELQKAHAKAADTQQLPLSSMHGWPPPQNHLSPRQ